MKSLIDELGGTSAVARALGVKNQAVWNWKRRGWPDSAKWKLLELAHQKGIKIDMAEMIKCGSRAACVALALGFSTLPVWADGNHSRAESAEGMANAARSGVEGPFETILTRNIWAGIFGRQSYYEPGGRSQNRYNGAVNGMLGHI